MSQSITRLGLGTLAFLTMLAASGAARAQYTAGVATDGRGPYTTTYVSPRYIPPYEGRVPDAPPDPRYTALLMTSINYPGVYGAYTIGIEAREYRGPFQPPELDGAMSVRLQAVVPQLPTTDNTASVDVRLPITAELWFQGVRMNQAGAFRRFVTPPLVADRSYSYDVRATWEDNGRSVAQDRVVRVSAGDRLTIDFTGPAPATGGTSELRTVPIR